MQVVNYLYPTLQGELKNIIDQLKIFIIKWQTDNINVEIKHLHITLHCYHLDYLHHFALQHCCSPKVFKILDHVLV